MDRRSIVGGSSVDPTEPPGTPHFFLARKTKPACGNLSPPTPICNHMIIAAVACAVYLLSSLRPGGEALVRLADVLIKFRMIQ